MLRPVLVVEDDEATLRAITREVLRRDLDPVPCRSIAEAKRNLLQLEAPLAGLVIDVILPDGSGLDLLAFLRPRFPDVSAMVMTGQISPELVNRAHLLDAVYAIKPDSLENLRRFLETCAQPSTFLGALPRFAAEHGLTPRETDVLMALARGVPRTELADRLGIAEASVKTHVKRILRRTGDANAQALVARLLRLAAGTARPS